MVAISIGIALFTLASTGVGQAAGFDPEQMVYPVGGENRLTDSFGDCRGFNCSRSHEGVDIMAPKGAPVYAVADGVVNWISDNPSECCFLGLNHGNGWLTRYIHLNDDAQDSNGNYIDHTDDQGWGIAPGIVHGGAVTRGQLIGWVGDSGNAAEGVTHLHFELRRYSGSQWDSYAIDPYPYLLTASASYFGQFYDDEGSKHEADIEKIYASGITRGCNPPTNNRYCPDEPVSRGAMAAFIRRWLELPTPAEDYYSDDNGNIFEGDINAITAAEIGFGCGDNSYCPDVPFLREEFAEMFRRAFGYTNPTGTDWFTDDNDSAYEDSINALRAAGVTKGCNPPDNTRFCTYLPVDRAAMASFFVRALDL
ncbi:MAG: M23 family metallopeptidase [Acidimicrobiia bacterium]